MLRRVTLLASGCAESGKLALVRCRLGDFESTLKELSSGMVKNLLNGDFAV